jgi:hypothetical protein
MWLRRTDGPRSDRSGWGELAWGLAVAVPAALLLLWPSSIFPNLAPLNPNQALHLLVLRHLGHWVSALLAGHPVPLNLIDECSWPNGLPIRVVAWPYQLVALPFTLVVSEIAAFNIAKTLLLALAGVAMWAWLRRIGLGRPAAVAGTLALQASPLLLTFLSNGQVENHLAAAFPLLLLCMAHGGPAGAGLVAIVAAAAAFSSPYQAVPLALLCGIGILFTRGWGQRVLVAGAFAAGTLPAWAYFGTGQYCSLAGGLRGPSSGEVPATLSDALVPALRGWQAARLAELWNFFRYGDVVTIGTRWEGRDLVHIGYLGLALVVVGGMGLLLALLHRSDQRRNGAIVGLFTLLTFVLACGSSLRLSAGVDTGVPLPWALIKHFARVGELGTTWRFLTGASFGLAAGAAFLVEVFSRRAWLARAVSSLVVVAVLLDLLALAPVRLPIRAAHVKLPEGFDDAIGEPVFIVDPFMILPTDFREWLEVKGHTPIHDPPCTLQDETQLHFAAFLSIASYERRTVQELKEGIGKIRAVGVGGVVVAEYAMCGGKITVGDKEWKPSSVGSTLATYRFDDLDPRVADGDTVSLERCPGFEHPLGRPIVTGRGRDPVDMPPGKRYPLPEAYGEGSH